MPTKTKTKPAARSARPKNEAPMSPELSHELASTILKNAEEYLQEFSIEESKAGRLAREALRARRDGDKERAAAIIKPLFDSIGRTILDSAKSDEQPARDSESGSVTLPFSLPPEWKDEEPFPDRVQRLEVPDWVNVTPDEKDYALTMLDPYGSGEQDIPIDRGEFIRLKRWLAALRGYELRAPLDDFDVTNLNNKSKDQQEYQKIIITEEEIQMLLDLQYVENVLVANLRQRLKDGAPETAGKWRLSDDGSEIKAHKISGLAINGLDINEAEELAVGAVSANQ